METFKQFLEVNQLVGISTISYFANNILYELKKPVSVGRIKGYLYWMLTTTPESKQEAIPPGYADKYMDNLPKISMPQYIRVIESGGFVNFTTNTSKPNRQIVDDQNAGKITHKEYFSLKTDVNNLKEILNHLFRTLPVLATEFYKIAIKNKDQVNFKIPDTIHSFLEHPDTIVVHHYNKISGPEIRMIVDKLFPGQFERGYRVKSGFDIHHKDFKDPKITIGNSHTELIAWAIAGTIIREKNRILQKYYDSRSFGMKLLEIIKKYNEMDEKTLYGEYVKAKNLDS
jgi:hypothetical protein